MAGLISILTFHTLPAVMLPFFTSFPTPKWQTMPPFLVAVKWRRSAALRRLERLTNLTPVASCKCRASSSNGCCRCWSTTLTWTPSSLQRKRSCWNSTWSGSVMRITGRIITLNKLALSLRRPMFGSTFSPYQICAYSQKMNEHEVIEACWTHIAP